MSNHEKKQAIMPAKLFGIRDELESFDQYLHHKPHRR